MPDTFDSLRPRIIDYLYDRGIDPRKRFRCLNPSHLDRDPSMGFDPKRSKVHCFACGADYDLFDLLALDNNLSSPADALSLASERYGDGSARRSVSFSAADTSRITNRPAERAVPHGGEEGIGGCAPSFSAKNLFLPPISRTASPTGRRPPTSPSGVCRQTPSPASA